MEKLTQERLKEVLDYDSETGVFARLTNSGPAHIGDIAGYINNGYRVIRIDGKKQKAHRLAWLYVYGRFPDYGLDHRDRIKHHNWIDNLREASQSCNMKNTGNYQNNSSGVKGVLFDKSTNKWRAQIVINYKRKHLGLYNDLDNAVCARLAGEQCLDWSNCDSSSPAYKYVKEFI